jgi:hypothetical protein
VSATRWFVEQELPHRPVYVHPELLDEAMAGPQSAIPEVLLFRIYPDEVAVRDDLPRFRGELDALVRGERCEGCLLAPTTRRYPSLDAQIALAYETAIASEINAVRELGLGAEERELSAWQTRRHSRLQP